MLPLVMVFQHTSDFWKDRIEQAPGVAEDADLTCVLPAQSERVHGDLHHEAVTEIRQGHRQPLGELGAEEDDDVCALQCRARCGQLADVPRIGVREGEVGALDLPEHGRVHQVGEPFQRGNRTVPRDLCPHHDDRTGRRPENLGETLYRIRIERLMQILGHRSRGELDLLFQKVHRNAEVHRTVGRGGSDLERSLEELRKPLRPGDLSRPLRVLLCRLCDGPGNVFGAQASLQAAFASTGFARG